MRKYFKIIRQCTYLKNDLTFKFPAIDKCICPLAKLADSHGILCSLLNNAHVITPSKRWRHTFLFTNVNVGFLGSRNSLLMAFSGSFT